MRKCLQRDDLPVSPREFLTRFELLCVGLGSSRQPKGSTCGFRFFFRAPFLVQYLKSLARLVSWLTFAALHLRYTTKSSSGIKMVPNTEKAIDFFSPLSAGCEARPSFWHRPYRVNIHMNSLGRYRETR